MILLEKKIKQHSALIFSIILHLSLLSALLIHFQRVHSITQSSQSSVMQVQLMGYVKNDTAPVKPNNHGTNNHKLPIKSPIASSPANQLARHVSEIALNQEPSRQVKHESLKINQSHARSASSIHISHALTSSQLLAMSRYMHRRIAWYAHYPPTYHSSNTKSQVLIRFNVYPNGLIDKLAVKLSSGDPILDQAALSAVKNAAPFKKINRWIAHVQPCTMTIHFLR